MLMALLPFYGFAEVTISQYPALVVEANYNGLPQAAYAQGGLAGGEGVCTFHYALTSTTTAPSLADDVWTTDLADALVKATNAGTYYGWYWIESTVPAENVAPTNVPGTFVINKIPASVTTAPSKVNDLVYNGKLQTIISDGVANTGVMEYSLNNTDWNTALPQSKDAAASITVYYRAGADANHVASASANITTPTIAQKPFNITDFTVTRAKASANYNGAIQNSPYVVKFNVVDADDETLDLDEDYTVAYQNSDPADANPQAVDVYTATINAKAGGNFSGSISNANLEAIATGLGTWTINTKPITVRALNQTKTYDGTNALPSSEVDVAYQIIGVVAGETVGAPTLTVSGATCPSATITPSACAGTDVANYNINYIPATLTINKKSGLTITAPNASKDKGDPDPNPLGVVTLAGHVTDDADAIKAACTITRVAGETVGTHVINVTVDNTADVMANYEEPEVVPGVFTINGGDVLITLLPKSKTYGENDFDWTNAQPGVDYLVDGLEAGVSLKTAPTLSREQGETVKAGGYTITATGAVAPAGYGEIVYIEGTYTINKKTLKVNDIKDQTLWLNNTVADLNQAACTPVGLVKNDALEIDDTADPTLIFKLEFNAGVHHNAGKLDEATTYPTGIKVTLLSTNYELDGEQGTGKLIVLNPANTIVLNRPVRADWNPAATDIAANVIADNDGENRAITFGNFMMYKEKWYALVLPFETTVAEVSTNFGYAVVDVLNTLNNSNAVRFKLHMQTIPANTPFIIKINENKNMNTVVFSARQIVAPESDADLVQEDAYHNKFTGTYTAKNGGWLAKRDYIFSLQQTVDFYSPVRIGDTPAETSYLNPVCAYITYKDEQNVSNNAAILYIEEPDGSTTAIGGITADGEMIPAQGWYTLNGVKLQGMPTQKGIYINNGKKIVIK